MANRKEYIDKLTTQLEQWDNEIDKLEAKAEQARSDAKGDYQMQLQELQSKRREAENRIKEIREAGEGAWQELKSGTEEAFDTMKKALDNAMSRFK